MRLLDANQAVARVAYFMSDTIPAYPITPATPMIDWTAKWSSQNETNLEGMVPVQTSWQSEGGVAGALHGSIQCGGLGTTFTASQGLLLMLPAMYRMAGSLLPNVIHVATRSLAKHSLSIFSDHTDIMAVRDSGYALLGSTTVQEAQDMACIAHMATLKSNIPFLHFFDGFKTSHSIENIDELTEQQLRDLWPKKEIQKHRVQGLSPNNPEITGAAQNGPQFFKVRKRHAEYYKKLPLHLEKCMNDFYELTGREYHLFDYYGHPEATHVFIAMASAVGPTRETVAKLNNEGHKTGVIVIRLFKPFSHEHFLNVLPLTCTNLYTLEAGGDNTLKGGPVFQEVCAAVSEAFSSHKLLEFPKMNSMSYGLSGYPLSSDMLLSHFNRINEGKNSVPLFLDTMVSKTEDPFSPISEAIFVSRKTFDFDVKGFMNELLKNGYDYVQGNTHVTYKKNDPLQRMQIRWSSDPILPNHLVQSTHVLFAHYESLPFLESEMEQLRNEGTLFVVGPGDTKDTYGKELQKLQSVLNTKDCKMIWISMPETTGKPMWSDAFQELEQYDISHKTFGKTHAELWQPGYYVPDWDSNACTQCGLCSLVCPSGALEAKAFEPTFGIIAPSKFPISRANDSIGLKEEGSFSIQVSAKDCDGCYNCVTSCPENALGKSSHSEEERAKHWKFFSKLPSMTTDTLDKTHLFQLQLAPSFYKYPMSDKGSAVSVYLKLLSQLFGDSLVIANATGSSSIIAGTEGYSPWKKNKEGRGPAWSNSLFENNAEYGLGMRLQYDQEKARAQKWLKKYHPDLLHEWVERDMDQKPAEEQRLLISGWKSVLNTNDEISDTTAYNLDALVKKTIWCVGGDGWAYDIGYGGLDHALASGANVNLLVLDNELYENTGGQFSKASPLAASGLRPKKDLGRMAMIYDHVYVASVSYGANPEQLLKAMKEAESYEGPSLILAYAHCESHGIDMKEPHKYHKAIVDSGSWLLYRRDPRLQHPLQLDSPRPSIAVAEYLGMEGRFQEICDPSSKKYDPEIMEQLQNRVDKRYRSFESQNVSSRIFETAEVL
ncbi:MAG: hypothetical protein Aureis2KO_03880 [Aureisphaera sp.]